MSDYTNQKILIGDSRQILSKIAKESVSYIITSPPYWNILSKKTAINKRKERLSSGLETKYSISEDDLGNIDSYSKFLEELEKCFEQCYRILENRRYTTIIVSDFRHKSELFPFHSDVVNICNKIGFTLQGIGILVQRNKKLYPYGYPYAYVPNIHHQYALTFRKLFKQ